LRKFDEHLADRMRGVGCETVRSEAAALQMQQHALANQSEHKPEKYEHSRKHAETNNGACDSPSHAARALFVEHSHFLGEWRTLEAWRGLGRCLSVDR